VEEVAAEMRLSASNANATAIGVKADAEAKSIEYQIGTEFEIFKMLRQKFFEYSSPEFLLRFFMIRGIEKKVEEGVSPSIFFKDDA